MSNIEQLVLQAKTCFQVKDYETCISITDEALRADPNNTEASWLMKEAQRQWEDQRSLEQLEIYVENLKKEAMDLFDKEHFEQCLGMFRFLLELEPENHTLRDYVRLSQQMFVESIGSGEPTAIKESASSLDLDFRERHEGVDVGAQPLETNNDLPAADVPALEGKASESSSATRVPETGAPQAVTLDTATIPQSVKRKIIREYLASTRPARRSWTLGLTTALIVVTILGAACFWLYSSFFASRIEILSAPEDAAVFIDNKKVGETPFRQEGLTAGSHVLRIERQGYQPLRHNITIRRAQVIILSVQLESAKPGASATRQSTAPLALQIPTPTPAPLPVVSHPVETETTVEQIAQSVIHHHLLGSCTGRLKIDGDRISFWSSGNPQDAFTRKIKQINNFKLDEKLLIEFKDKAYRFEALARDSKGNRQRLAPFYEQIKLQKAPPQKPL